MKKGILSFIFSFVFAFILGGIMWLFFEFLGSSDNLNHFPWVKFILENPLVYITLLGMSLGSITGILFVDKVFFGHSPCSKKRILLSFFIVLLGMLLMSFLGVYASSHDIPRSFYFLRGGLFVLATPFIAALLTSLVYSIRSE